MALDEVRHMNPFLAFPHIQCGPSDGPLKKITRQRHRFDFISIAVCVGLVVDQIIDFLIVNFEVGTANQTAPVSFGVLLPAIQREAHAHQVTT